MSAIKKVAANGATTSTQWTDGGTGFSARIDESNRRILTVDIAVALRLTGENPNILLELIGATVLSVTDSKTVRNEKLVVLRSEYSKPALQAVFYEVNDKLPPIEKGESVQVIGKMLGKSRRFLIMKIKVIEPLRYELLAQRLEALSNVALQKIQ